MTAETDWRATDEVGDRIVTYTDPAHRFTHEVVTGVCRDCKDGWPLRCYHCLEYVTWRKAARSGRVQACECTRRHSHYRHPAWWRPAS